MRRYRKVSLGPRDVVVERADGTIHLRSPHALGSYPKHLCERLEHWATHAPDRVLFAQREGERWKTLSYSQALERARRIGEFLLRQKLSAERPLMVLSGNDLEHALLHRDHLARGVSVRHDVAYVG